MGSCTVPGLWNQVRGNPPFLSEQEFMAENINLLCQLLTGGGGGIGGGTPQVFSGHGAPVGLQTAPNGRVQDGTLAAIYQDVDEGYLIYPWDIPSQSWGGI